MNNLKARRVIALVAMMAFLAGVREIIQDWPLAIAPYPGTISGFWASFLNVVSWIWLVSVPLAILVMASGFEIKWVSIASSALWFIWVIPVWIDAWFFYTGKAIPITLMQFFAYGSLFFLAPGIIMADLQDLMGTEK